MEPGGAKKIVQLIPFSYKPFIKLSLILTSLEKASFTKHYWKGENAGNQHFLLLPQCFLLYKQQILPFQPYLISHLQTL